MKLQPVTRFGGQEVTSISTNLVRVTTRTGLDIIDKYIIIQKA